jgi:hypothetical protein
MNLAMKNLAAYKRRAVFAMVVVMCFHILTGLRPFCGSGSVPPLRAAGMDGVAKAIPTVAGDQGEIASAARDNPGTQKTASKCSCKKQKKCAAIPRAVLTSNPSHRFNEVQRQAKSVCLDSLVWQVTDYRLASEENRLLMELACCSPFFCSNPLALTSVLLI